MSVTTFQGFLDSSLEYASSSNAPTLQQMAALSAYTKAAMIAQRELQMFTPTIYSYMSSLVLSQRYPGVHYNNKFYPIKEVVAVSNNESSDENNVTISSTSDSETTLDTTAALDAIENTPPKIAVAKPKKTTSIPSKTDKRRVSQIKKIKVEEEVDDEEDEDDGPPVLEKIITTTPIEKKQTRKSITKKEKDLQTPSPSPDGYKHPKKPLELEKIESPQLLPNGFLKCMILEDPTAPLEEWFLANLSNPFPTSTESNKLQYLSGMGHLTLRQWFVLRRKVFCRQNPKARPWKNRLSLPSKRLSSSSDEKKEVAAAKKCKLEVSEMNSY